MLDFQLFRMRVLPAEQRELFAKTLSRPEMLRTVLESKPHSEFRAGQNWHIGNISYINSVGLYFRLGKTNNSTIATFDEKVGNFVDEEFAETPYTHAVLDIELEICAIAKKTKLSKTTPGIAKKLIRLLNESQKAKELHATFEIDELKDPEDFISQLKQAYSVSRFTMFLSRPNAWDANEHFVKPTQKLIEAVEGDKGKVEVRGSNLNTEVLEKVTRSVAATGDDASARLQAEENDRPITKRLKGSNVSVSHESVDNSEDQEELLNRMRILYKKIRGKESE
jgi:hypothetical protein